jgi:hypothetical protein
VPDLDRKVTTVGQYLDRHVDLLRDSYRDGDRLAAGLIRAAGGGETTEDEVLASALTLEQAQLAIARDHGYSDWAAAQSHAADPVDSDFEAACDAIQWGDLEALGGLLDERPELARERSPFAHRSTLLHYVAANGIEAERQIQSPANAVEIMRLLLERGAEADALCEAYGGGRNQTTLCLLVSSCVPAAAGVQAPLVEELSRGGARVNGLDDDGTRCGRRPRSDTPRRPRRWRAVAPESTTSCSRLRSDASGPCRGTSTPMAGSSPSVRGASRASTTTAPSSRRIGSWTMR